ncbi:uncharacterized protein [Eurosta solidaginis]|uniref:uncharacterized protein isoform X2 n=1 Tax=Eurosta solidaginis TaxID=178769 RepID=UPI00353165A1
MYVCRSFKIIFTSFPYQKSPELMDITVQIVNNTVGGTYLTIVTQVNEDLDDVHFTYAVALETNVGNYTTLVNRTVNWCKFLKQRSIDPVLRVIYEDIQKHGNLFKNCPMKKGIYMVREYQVDEEMLPNHLPEANFFVYINFAKTKEQMIFDGKLYGKIDKSKGFNNLKMFSLG